MSGASHNMAKGIVFHGGSAPSQAAEPGDPSGCVRIHVLFNSHESVDVESVPAVVGTHVLIGLWLNARSLDSLLGTLFLEFASEIPPNFVAKIQ